MSTFAQRVDDSCVFENRKMLPEKNVDEKATEHPNLHAEQSHREKDHEHRRGAADNHSCDQEGKYNQQEKNAIDEDAQRCDARPEPHGVIESSEKSDAPPGSNFSGNDLNTRHVNRPHRHRENEHQKSKAPLSENAWI